MFGPSRPQAVAFDVIGTTFTLDALRPRIEALGLPPAALEGWFAAGCRDAFALAAVGDYAPFAEVLRAALDELLAEQRLDPPAAARDAVLAGMADLQPRDGAAEAYGLLAAEGVPVVALTNGSQASTRKLLERWGLWGSVAHLVSIDDVRRSKPAAEVYIRAASQAGVAPDRLALVAAHPWDVNGAEAAGLVAAYLDADRPYSTVMRKPDVTAASLPDCVRGLLAF